MAATVYNLDNSAICLLGNWVPNLYYGTAQVGAQLRVLVSNGKKAEIILRTLGGANASPWHITVDGIAIIDPVIDDTDTLYLIFDEGSDGEHLVVLTKQGSGTAFIRSNGLTVTADGAPAIESGLDGKVLYNVDPTNDSFIAGEVRPSDNQGSGYAFLRYMDESRVFKATTESIQVFAAWLGAGDAFMSLYVDGEFHSQVSYTVTGDAGDGHLAHQWTALDDTEEHEYQITVDSALGDNGPIVHQLIADSINTGAFGATRDILLFLGDSNTFAAGIVGKSSLGFSALTGRALNLAVANRGVSGIKVAGVTPNIAGYVSALVKAPSHVVVLLGTNDWSLSPTDLTQFEGDCVDFLNELRSEVPTGPISVLKIIYGTNPSNDALIDSYNAKWISAIETVADPRITLYDTPVWLATGGTRDNYQDQQHMNTAGHSELSGKLLSEVFSVFSPAFGNAGGFNFSMGFNF